MTVPPVGSDSGVGPTVSWTDGATPSPAPPPVPGDGDKRRFGIGTGTAVVLGALAAGVAFGAFALSTSGGGTSTPSPTPTPTSTPSDSPAVIIDTVRFTIPEGFTAARIYARGEELLGIPVADFEAAAADAEAIGLPPEANGQVEGWLGPFTYQIPENATAEEVLAELIDATLMHLDSRGVAPEDRMVVLTKASLIEKEVRRPEDRPKVARVIENRLARNMMLQFDSTVHYIVGADSVFTSDDDRAVDSPYNTYLYTGLPPGPICSPGLPSIEAAITPADGPWLYFVAINLDTGETVFAETYEQHLDNVEILHDWMDANR